MIQFILLCILIGAIITRPSVRAFLGQGCMLFIVGFLALIAFGMIVLAMLGLLFK